MAEDYGFAPSEESDVPPPVPSPPRSPSKRGKTRRERDTADGNRRPSAGKASPRSRDANGRRGISYADDVPEASISNDEVTPEDRRSSRRTREDGPGVSKPLNGKRAQNKGKHQESPPRQKVTNGGRKPNDVKDKGRRKPQFDQGSSEAEEPKPGPKRGSPSYTNFVPELGTSDDSVAGEPGMSPSTYGLPGRSVAPNRGASGRRVSARIGNGPPSSIKCGRCGAGPETVGEIFEKLPACRYCVKEVGSARAQASPTRPSMSSKTSRGSGARPLYSRSATDIGEFGPAVTLARASSIALSIVPSYESNDMTPGRSFESVWEEAPHSKRLSFYSPPSESAALLANTHVPYGRRGEGTPSFSGAYGGIRPRPADSQSLIVSEVKRRQAPLAQGTNVGRNASITLMRPQGRVGWDIAAGQLPSNSIPGVQCAGSCDGLLIPPASPFDVASVVPSMGGTQEREFQQQQQRHELLRGRRPRSATPPPPGDSKQEDGMETRDEYPDEDQSFRIRVSMKPKSRRSHVQLAEAKGHLAETKRPPAKAKSHLAEAKGPPAKAKSHLAEANGQASPSP